MGYATSGKWLEAFFCLVNWSIDPSFFYGYSCCCYQPLSLPRFPDAHGGCLRPRISPKNHDLEPKSAICGESTFRIWPEIQFFRHETWRNGKKSRLFHEFSWFLLCSRFCGASNLGASKRGPRDCERARGVPTSAAPFRFPKKELERYKIWYVLIYGTPKRYKIYEAFEEHRGF
jgi:hypothetical protein